MLLLPKFIHSQKNFFLKNLFLKILFKICMCVCELDMGVSEAVDEGGGIAGDGVLFVDLT